VLNLLIAFLPAAVLGLAFASAIKARLFAPVPVAGAFIAGALVILWAERRQRARPDSVRIRSVDELRWTDALKIGFAQAFALIPGTSRSGATIIGGMLFGLSRQAATEFSFFLAIPTLFAATGYDLVKNRHLLSTGDLSMIAVGFAVAFVSAFFTIRALLRYVAHHDFVSVRLVPDRLRPGDPRHGVRRSRALGLAGFRRGGGSDLVGPAFAMVGVLGFAFKAILIKLAYASTSIDAVTLLTLRMAYSAPFFALMAWWSTRAPNAKPLARRDWLSIVWLGFIGYYLSSLSTSSACNTSPPPSNG
jgi:hypothetical protein